MNADAYTVAVTAENFQTEVAEKSGQFPVLLEFYTEGEEQCRPVSELLARLVAEYQGKFTLARVDIRQNQQLAQQLGVRTLPTIKIVYQGRMAGDIEGQVDEGQLRNTLDQLTLSPMERVKEQIDVLVSQGDRRQAIELLQQIIADEPQNFALQAELCDLLIMEEDVDDARRILDALPAETEGIEKPKSRLGFIDLASDLRPQADLQQAVAEDGANLQARFDLAVRLLVKDQIGPALEALFEIMKLDKTWKEELARETMIKVFKMLGKGNELATSYRRKMFTLLH